MTKLGHRRKASQGGFAMLVVFAFAAAIAVALYMEVPRLMFESQRQKEELLIERGEQYKRAIQLYVRKLKKYPQTMEELEEYNGVRFLRKKYKDPFTGKDDWRIIHVNNGVLLDSKIQKPNQNGQPGQPGQMGQQGGMQMGMGQSNQPDPAQLAQMQQQQAMMQAQAMNQGGFPPVGLVPGQTGQQQLAPGVAKRPSDRGAMGANSGASSSGDGANADGSNTDQNNNSTDQTKFDPNAPVGMPIAGQNTQQTGTYPGQPGYQQYPGQTSNNVNYQGQPGQPGFPGVGGSQMNIPGIGNVYRPQTGMPTYPTTASNSAMGGMVPVQVPGSGSSSFGSFGSGGAMQPGAGPLPTGMPNPAMGIIQGMLTTPRPGGLAGLNQANGQGGQAMGSGIAGIASKAEMATIKVYGEKQKTDEWEFIYDPAKEKRPGQTNGQQNGMPGQNGQMGNGMGNNSGFGNSNTGFGGNSGFGNSGTGFGSPGGTGGFGMPSPMQRPQ